MSRAATTRPGPAVRSRRAAVLAAVPATVLTPLLLAGPAWAGDPLGPSEGARPGRGLSAGATLLLFVAVPLVIIGGTAALVWLPGLLTANRYRPNRGWAAAPVWFAGPPEPARAVQDAQLGELVRGGAGGSW